MALEIGRRRTFAAALAWPGWCRSGRTEEAALDALAAYAPRYAAVLAAAGIPFLRAADDPPFEIAERLEGDASTDFGVPGQIRAADLEPLDIDDAERLAAILSAAWAAIDRAAADAEGVPLRLGPRGGGRDVGRIVDHVNGADAAYLVALGAARPAPASAEGPADPAAAVAAVRREALAALRARALGLPLEHPSRAKHPWPARYYAARAAWHAIDHAWEIEDRRT